MNINELSMEYMKNNKIESGELTFNYDNMDDIFSYYRKAMENKDIATMEFTDASSKGDLILTDEHGITILMENRDVYGKKYNAWNRLDYTYVPYDVAIKSIDEENQIVYVSAVLANEYKGKVDSSSVNRDLMKAYNNLKDGEILKVPGRIITVVGHGSSAYAIINLLNIGITGYIGVKDWSKGYVRELSAVCRPGACYEFELQGRVEKTLGFGNKKRKRMGWTCSRVNLTKDPWSVANLGQFKKGDLVTVKCVEIPKDVTGAPKTYWWGTCDRVRGIEIFCDYTSNVLVIKGQKYICSVTSIDIENNMFKVSPLKHCGKFKNTTPLFRPVKK